MTGPNYPREDLPGSNAIGSLVIGVSPIGTLKPFDVWRTVMSQYANSPALMGIIQSLQDCIDQTANIDRFFDLVVNVYTAQGYGLDVWGRIVAVNRVLSIGVGPKYWGFDEGGLVDYEPFNQEGPFYSGQKLTQNWILSDTGFRVLILAKAFSNICDGSVPAINRLLRMLFGSSGKCYVVDNGDMTMTYKFEFNPTAVQLAILEQSGVFPRPTGVSATVEHVG